MSNTLRSLEKMRHHPYDWRIEQLEAVAKRFGVQIRKSGESHVIFDHPDWVELLSVPARRPIKPIYVKKLVALIDLLYVTA